MDNYQIAFLLTLAVQIICTIVMIKYQGYFHKKGANAADKEDIAELTRMVESVKSEFVRENAKINSDLDILKDRRGKNYTQAQQAIISYFSDLQGLISFLTSISVPEKSVEKIDDVLQLINEKLYKVEVSVNVMQLLVEDSQSGQLGLISLDYLALIHYIRLALIKSKNTIKTDQHLSALMENYSKLNIEQATELQSDIKKNYEEQKRMAEEYYSERNEFLKPIFIKQREFRLFAQEFLKA